MADERMADVAKGDGRTWYADHVTQYIQGEAHVASVETGSVRCRGAGKTWQDMNV
jgi:hypothetical protein